MTFETWEFFSNTDVFRNFDASTLFIPVESNKIGVDCVIVEKGRDKDKDNAWLIQISLNDEHKTLNIKKAQSSISDDTRTLLRLL